MANILYFLALMETLVVLAGAASSMDPHCKLQSCKYKGKHTMCKFEPSVFDSRKCGTVQSWTLTSPEKNEILKAHNEFRRKVASGKETRGSNGPQPAATNLGDLRWNNELANIAQAWANQCTFSHDECRDSIDSSIEQVGQNVAYMANSRSYTATFTQLVKLWSDEVKLFDRNDIKSYRFESGTGHYTQMVWANTKYVGCGAIRYNAGDGLFKTYLVCNYGPAGNFDGEPIYLTA